MSISRIFCVYADYLVINIAIVDQLQRADHTSYCKHAWNDWRNAKEDCVERIVVAFIPSLGNVAVVHRVYPRSRQDPIQLNYPQNTIIFIFINVTTADLNNKNQLIGCSRLPSFSYRTESISEQLDFSEHRGEPVDQRDQPHVWHRGNKIVEHAPLTEQRVCPAFGCI